MRRSIVYLMGVLLALPLVLGGAGNSAPVRSGPAVSKPGCGLTTFAVIDLHQPPLFPRSKLGTGYVIRPLACNHYKCLSDLAGDCMEREYMYCRTHNRWYCIEGNCDGGDDGGGSKPQPY